VSEEVEQWRAERRSRFPSKVNVDRREESIQKLEEMGGVLTSDSHKKGRRERPCKYFQKSGRCNNANCSFSHERVETASAKRSATQLCPYFRSGKCKRGSRCPFSHEAASSAADSSDQTPNDLAAVSKQGDDKDNAHTEYVADEREGVVDPSPKRAKMEASENPDAGEEAHSPQRAGNKQRGSRGGQSHRGAASGMVQGREGKVKDGLFLPAPYEGGQRGTLLKRLLSSEIAAQENILLQVVHFLVREQCFQPSAADDKMEEPGETNNTSSRKAGSESDQYGNDEDTAAVTT
jgi:hypothetical protein